MARPDRLIFYTGAPGSKWSAVSHIISKNTRWPIDSTDYDPLLRHYTGPSLGVSHQGAYFGPGNGIGEGFHELSTMSRSDILAEIDRGWPAPQADQWRIVKCHHFAHHLDFIAETFPESAIVMVMRPEMMCYYGWLRSGGFEKITYPDYHAYYKNEERMRQEIGREIQATREFIHDRDIDITVIRERYWQQTWGLARSHSEEMDRYMRSIEYKLSDDGKTTPAYDTFIAAYNLPGL